MGCSSASTAPIGPVDLPTINARYDAALAAIPDGPAKRGGIRTGEAAAKAMIRARKGDGRFGEPGFDIDRPLGPGVWDGLPVNDPARVVEERQAVHDPERRHVPDARPTAARERPLCGESSTR